MATSAKIVAVHGRNISLSIEYEDLSRAPEDFKGALTLPAMNIREVDYASLHIGDYVDFDVWHGKLWFPFLYQGKPLNEGLEVEKAKDRDDITPKEDKNQYTPDKDLMRS